VYTRAAPRHFKFGSAQVQPIGPYLQECSNPRMCRMLVTSDSLRQVCCGSNCWTYSLTRTWRTFASACRIVSSLHNVSVLGHTMNFALALRSADLLHATGVMKHRLPRRLKHVFAWLTNIPKVWFSSRVLLIIDPTTPRTCYQFSSQCGACMLLLMISRFCLSAAPPELPPRSG
jgi:hypothetical protein